MRPNTLYKTALAVLLLFALVALPSGTSRADTTDTVTTPSGGKCENKFPDLFKDICWKCMFPIRIGGRKIMDTGSMPDNISELTGNIDDYNPDKYLCSCKDSDDVTYYGVMVSFWEPVRVMEVVPKPGCFNFLFGMDLSSVLVDGYGTKGQAQTTALEKSFQQVHYIHAPLMQILEIFGMADFCADWLLTGLDIAYMTEVDPVWNNEELDILVRAEAAVFGNPIAQALCAVDCLAASVGYPLNPLFWCAGCWGGTYPMSGNVLHVGSPVTVSSLQMTKLLARLTRYPVPPAQEYDTSSVIAECGAVYRPVIKKSQYRINTLNPIAESTSFHTIGASSLTWGEWRNIPATGENHTFVVWRKRNCCLSLTDY